MPDYDWFQYLKKTSLTKDKIISAACSYSNSVHDLQASNAKWGKFIQVNNQSFQALNGNCLIRITLHKQYGNL